VAGSSVVTEMARGEGPAGSCFWEVAAKLAVGRGRRRVLLSLGGVFRSRSGMLVMKVGESGASMMGALLGRRMGFGVCLEVGLWLGVLAARCWIGALALSFGALSLSHRCRSTHCRPLAGHGSLERV